MTHAPVFFDDAFEKLERFIEDHQQHKFIFIVDENTHEFCLPLLLAEIPEIADIEIIEIPVGEEAKSIEIALQVWESLGELGADRNSIIVNCGGGVVTDFGGFVASTFKRGLRFINVPTSLLSMVDASVGAKTGINLNHLKNQIGTFAAPEMVIISPEFLETLPEVELLSGFAEMLKHGLIKDEQHWTDLKNITKVTHANIASLIPKSVAIKKAVVDKDPLEKGIRKILNAGHTLGHALESYYLSHDIEITHGQVVAVGLILESQISASKSCLSWEDLQEITSVIEKYFPKVTLPNSEQILPLLLHDKKNVGQEIKCMLLKKIGECIPESTTISKIEIHNAFEFYRNNYK